MSRKQKNKTAASRSNGGGAKRHLIALALLGVSIFLAYANSLTGTWALDDVVANRPVAIHDLRDLLDFRKVAYFTFLLNQQVAPFSPVSFRLVNILIHILNSALVYLLAYRTFLIAVEDAEVGKGRGEERASGALKDRAFAAALLGSVVFALHPININAVAYIVQRMTALATLFVLLSLLCYVFAARSGNRGGALLLYALSGATLFAGIFSKENAVMAVPLIALYDYVFLSRHDRRRFLKKVLLLVFIGGVGIGLASYFLKFHKTFLNLARLLLDFNKPLSETGWTAIDVYWTPLQHILTEFRVVSRYLFLLFLPLPQNLVFDWWGFPLSRGITDPVSTLFSMLLIFSLVIFSLWKLKRLPFLSFGILWYLVAISLETFLAVGSDLYFEHRNHLPLAGLVVGIAGQAVLSLGGKINDRRVWTAAAAFCLVLGGLTFTRNFVWKDALTLWGDTIQKTSSNIRAMVAMGNAHLKLADLNGAEKYYRDAVKISARDRRVKFLDESAYSLGMLYLFRGELKQAKELMERYARLVDSYKPKILEGFYRALSGDIEGALGVYREVIWKTDGIDTVVVHTLIGDAYREKGQWDEAIRSYENALSLDPGFSAAHYGAGASYMGKRDLPRAEELFERALSLDPYHVLALSDMADLMLIKKEPQRAFEYARRAVEKTPSFPQPYTAMGSVLIVLGRESEADGFYKRAEERGIQRYMVPFSKARAYYLRGDIERARHYLSEMRKYDLPEKFRGIANQGGM